MTRTTPENGPYGNVAPTCTCGHAVGDHKSNQSRTNLQFGVCLVTECACLEFRDLEQVRRDIETLSRAALTPYDEEGAG